MSLKVLYIENTQLQPFSVKVNVKVLHVGEFDLEVSEGKQNWKSKGLSHKSACCLLHLRPSYGVYCWIEYSNGMF